MRSRSFAAWLLGLTIVVAGCGSTVETKQDYIARANAICASTTRAIRNVAPAGASGGVSLPALGRYLDTVTPLVDSEVKQLRVLPRPAADRKLLERYLAAAAAEAAGYRGLAAAARSGNHAAVTAATAALQASPATTLAGQYGLSACVGGSGTVAPS
jgi:hypothetical protein